jgi:hypothetical protein
MLRVMPDGQPEEYLSVNWLEYLHGTDTNVQIERARSELGANLRLSRSHRLLKLSVGDTRKDVAQKMMDGRQLAFHHAWLTTSHSHSGVYGYRPEDEMVADLIAETVTERFDAVAAPLVGQPSSKG